MIKRLAREAVLSLWLVRQRASLAVVGIAIGIASVIAMVTAGKIVERETLRQFETVGMDYFVVTFADTKKLGPLEPADADAFLLGLPSVQSLVPYVGAVAQVQAGRRLVEAPVLGVEERFTSVNRLEMAAGRSLHSLDQTSAFCVLGAELVTTLGYAPVEAVGQAVRVGGVNHTVVGVLAPNSGGSVTPFNVNRAVLLPFAKARRSFPANPPVALFGRVGPKVDPRTVTEEIATYFRRFHQETQASVATAEQLIAKLEDQTRLFTLMLGAIAAISLMVGGVGVMNMMLVSVAERRVEIGLRRALGAERRHVQQQFVLEALMLCLVGGLAGTVMGIGAAWGIAHFAKWEFRLHVPAVLLGVGVSCAIGIFFGFYPAYQAARMDIIAALRSRR